MERTVRKQTTEHNTRPRPMHLWYAGACNLCASAPDAMPCLRLFQPCHKWCSCFQLPQPSRVSASMCLSPNHCALFAPVSASTLFAPAFEHAVVTTRTPASNSLAPPTIGKVPFPPMGTCNYVGGRLAPGLRVASHNPDGQRGDPQVPTGTGLSRLYTVLFEWAGQGLHVVGLQESDTRAKATVQQQLDSMANLSGLPRFAVFWAATIPVLRQGWPSQSGQTTTDWRINRGRQNAVVGQRHRDEDPARAMTDLCSPRTRTRMARSRRIT
jgi:hypothetical protein